MVTPATPLASKTDLEIPDLVLGQKVRRAAGFVGAADEILKDYGLGDKNE